jgi:hypothetical protein
VDSAQFYNVSRAEFEIVRLQTASRSQTFFRLKHLSIWHVLLRHTHAHFHAQKQTGTHGHGYQYDSKGECHP